VIVHQFAPAPDVAPATPPRPVWAFLASLEGTDLRYTTAAEIQARLRQVGFRRLSEAILPQRGTLRWSQGWTMIEAWK
jgi:hypothetical protein